MRTARTDRIELGSRRVGSRRVGFGLSPPQRSVIGELPERPPEAGAGVRIVSGITTYQTFKVALARGRKSAMGFNPALFKNKRRE